jgi:hypothetical protein
MNQILHLISVTVIPPKCLYLPLVFFLRPKISILDAWPYNIMHSQHGPGKEMVTLMYASLLKVFNQRSPGVRLAAIKSTYTDDFIFYEPDKVYHGHAELDRCVQSLLDKHPDWTFRPDGPVSMNHNLGVTSWHFGLDGKDPVVKVTDVFLTECEKIKTLYVSIEGAN